VDVILKDGTIITINDDNMRWAKALYEEYRNGDSDDEGSKLQAEDY